MNIRICRHLCRAMLASALLLLPCAAAAQGQSGAWRALQAGPPAGALWSKGLGAADLAKRMGRSPAADKTPPRRQQNAVRRKSPPPTWDGSTPEQRAAIQARSRVPEHSLAPERAPSRPLPILGNVEDRSHGWHVDPNRPDMGESVFTDRRQTITGMVGYSDSRVAFGIGPEITIDDGGRNGLRSHASTPSPAAGQAEGNSGGNGGSSHEDSTPPPVDVGMGMRLRIGF
ncbi:MAG: hypothetical protein ACI33N_06395 [Desulfovibrionaceae bacterium]